MKNWNWSKVFFLFIIPVFLYISLLPVLPLIEPDEARYSDIPSLMNRTGDYITPQLNHLVYLEKPPLCYWATALAFKIFGENEFSARLFAALCAWGCIFLVYRMGTFFHDEKTGLYSAGVLSTFLYFSVLGKINVLDIPLTFFVSLATWAGYRYLAGDFERKGWVYLLYISSALGFLTKGLIGIVFPFAILVLWFLISGRWRSVSRLFSPAGMILFLLISCPWIILVQKANKDFLWFFFIQEHLLRYSTRFHGRSQTILFYIPVVLLGTLPWSAFLWKALKGGTNEGTPIFGGKEKRFFLVWIFFIIIFFSISSSKLVPYIAPVFLPIAIMFGHLFRLYEGRKIRFEIGRGRRFLYNLPIIFQSLLLITALILPSLIKYLKPSKDWGNMHFENEWPLIVLPILFQMMMMFLPGFVKRRWGSGWFLTIVVLACLFLISAHFPVAKLLTPYKSAYPVSRAIQTFVPPNRELFQFRISLYGIDFYNKIRTPMIDPSGELELGFKQLRDEERRHYYPSHEEFIQRCKEEGGAYCVTRYRNVKELKIMVPTLEVLWNNGEFYLLRLPG